MANKINRRDFIGLGAAFAAAGFFILPRTTPISIVAAYRTSKTAKTISILTMQTMPAVPMLI